MKNSSKKISDKFKKFKKQLKEGYEYLKKSFVLETGRGNGFSLEDDTSFAKIGINDSTNIVSKYKQGKKEEYLEQTRGISLGVVGISQNLVDLETEGLNHYPTTYSIGIIEFSDTDGTIFIGHTTSLHFYVGGYVKIGFEIKMTGN